jgi:serine/threonine-protein kinase
VTSFTAGAQFGRYRIERQIGQGGSGAVYLAEDTNPHLPRRVALKVLNPDLAADVSFRERFLRESLLAIELDHHANIVPVYDAGEADGALFIAMRYIDGTDLHSALAAHGPLDPQQAALIISQVASALDVAHAAGLVHRDVKPGNVLLSPDLSRAYLADFGLTKRVSTESGLTQAGQFLGTFYYAAPEQIEGRPVDARTDVYALGCVLFECLSGTPPYTGDMSTIIAAHLTRPAPMPSSARPGLPPALDGVVARAMEKLPDDRYQSCGDLAAAVQRATSEESATIAGGAPLVNTPVTAPPSSLPGGPSTPPPPPPVSVPPGPPTPPPGSWGTQPPAPARRRRGVWAALVGAIALVLVIVLVVVLVAGGGGGGKSNAFPNPAEKQLLRAVPVDFRDTCKRATPRAAGLSSEKTDATVRCKPGGNVSAAFFSRVGNSKQLKDAFDAVAKANDVKKTGEDCAQATRAENVQTTYETNSGGGRGRVLCYRGGSGSVLYWTVNNAKVIASVERGDRNDLDLYKFWAEMVDRKPPSVDTSAFPNPDEQRLLSHVPGDFNGTCKRAEPLRNSVASVQCTPSSGANRAFYTLFSNTPDLDGAYDQNRTEQGVARDSGNQCPSDRSYNQGAGTVGRILCYFQRDGTAVVIWSHDSLLILGEASRDDGSVSQLLDFWQHNAGPS